MTLKEAEKTLFLSLSNIESSDLKEAVSIGMRAIDEQIKLIHSATDNFYSCTYDEDDLTDFMSQDAWDEYVKFFKEEKS